MGLNFKILESCYAIHNDTLYKCLFYQKNINIDEETNEPMSTVKVIKKLPKTEYIFKCYNSDIRKNITDYPKEIQETLCEL